MNFSNASELLHYLEGDGFEVRAPIDVDDIAGRLGLEVLYDYELEPEGITGCIYLDDDEGATILINPVDNSYEPRRRFTLAHEIGHYCLHLNEEKREFIDSRKTMSRSASYWDMYEAQANTFAAQLLMPKNLLALHGKQIAQEYRTPEKRAAFSARTLVQRMAAEFEVSMPAMEYRLIAVGVLRKR